MPQPILTVQAVISLSHVNLAIFGVKALYPIDAYQDLLPLLVIFPHQRANPLPVLLQVMSVCVIFVILLLDICSFQALISVFSALQLVAQMDQQLVTVVAVTQVCGGME